MIAGAGATSIAVAQDASPAEQRVRIVRLSQEVSRLRQDLDAARAQMAQLQEQRQTLERALREAESVISRLRTQVGSVGVRIVEAPKAAIPDDPMASPMSLFRELRRRYARDLAGLAQDSDADLASYRRAVDTWCKATGRDLHGTTQWLTRIDGVERRRRGGYEARFQVLEDSSLLPIGDPFVLAIPRRFATRLLRDMDTFPLWRITGVLAAAPAYDPTRETPGVFDVPRFVGRYVGFDYSFEFKDVAGVEVDQKTERTPPAPGQAHSGER